VAHSVARFLLVQNTKTGENIPNYHKLYQMSIKYNKRPLNGPSVHKIYHHLPLQDPPKFTQIWIFGLKTNHLANLVAQIHGALVISEFAYSNRASVVVG
jgi:hypothetical protein